MNDHRPLPMPLRRRVTLWFTLLGFLLTLAFSASVLLITEQYENVLAAELLRGQAEDYSLRLANGLAAELPRTHRINGYRVGAPDLPPALASLPPGYHDAADSKGTHIGVFDTSAGRFVFVVDLSDIEALENLLSGFLAGMVVLGTVLAGWLGWWFAGHALRPVRRLVEDVDALSVEPQRTRLAAHAGHDELGRLAGAIDAYQARLVDADEREQSFFADASHELRTPLSVVQGVTEVMLDDPGHDPAHEARLHRLERGVRDMGNLIEALLGVARRSALHVEALDAREFIEATAHIAMPETGPAASETRVSIDASGVLQLPRREALLLVSGLLRKVVQQPPDAPIHVSLLDRELLIEKRAAEGSTTISGDVLRSDTGRGAALLDRLAQRMGCRVDFETPTRIRIHLPARPAADPQ